MSRRSRHPFAAPSQPPSEDAAPVVAAPIHEPEHPADAAPPRVILPASRAVDPARLAVRAPLAAVDPNAVKVRR